MERKIEKILEDWKNDGHRKALMIKGARQVGKTYSISRFGESNFEYYLRLDLRDEKFEEDFWKGQSKDIIRRITRRYTHFRAEKGKSLLFLDEIQDCPEAISALKTLADDGTLAVVCSGSLLGLYEKSPRRYPVGYIHEETMHPLDFEEYLWAIGMTHDQTEEIKEHVSQKRPFDPPDLHTLEDYYRQYLIVGGMPEVVSRSCDSDNAEDYIEAQDDIINGYEQDILAYAGDLKDDAMMILKLVPTELGRPNKRLRFKDIGGNNKGMREFREPIDWVEGSRFVTVCHRLSAIDRPLKGYSRESMIKMYLVDTGLLIRLYGDGTVEAMMRDDLSVNEGAIAENSVCQMLHACGIVPYYYEIDQEVEVDFICEIGTDLCAIEVKSGKKRRARSLKKLMGMESGKKVTRWIKFEYGNIMMTEDGVEHYPLFCAAFADLLCPRTVFKPKKADPNIRFA